MRPRKHTFLAVLIIMLCNVLTLNAIDPPDSGHPVRANQVGRSAKVSAPRPLTVDEGLAILGAALELRPHIDLRADCSHFVHAIYEHAGFHYRYVNSSALYRGSNEFRQVSNPQP